MKTYFIKNALLLLIIGALFSNNLIAQNKQAFTVKGLINGLANEELYLAYGSFNNMPADTVLSKDGQFEFKGFISEPCYGMLFNKNFSLKVDLLVDKGNILISGDMGAPFDISVKGSSFVNEYQAYNHALSGSKKPVQELFEKYIAAYNAGDSVEAKKYELQFSSARDLQSVEYGKLRLEFIQNHPGNNASAWELFHYVNEKTLAQSKSYFDGFTTAVKNSEHGNEVRNRIANLSRVETGKDAPAFEQNDLDNNGVTLASFKGKYVLLDFWASWCGPCRAENPNVLNAYNKYKDLGFDVLAVSLDHVKKNWETAIEKDGLPWTQVSDLKGWKNEVAILYGITAVPANFLIDPSGKIVAQNLRGEALNETLEKFLVNKK